MTRKTMKQAVLAAVLAGLASAPAAAGEGGGVSIELSAAQREDGSCLLSFVAQNGLPQDIESAVYEAVLFDAAGQVDRLALLDFQDLPAGRPRVRQFRFALECGAISRVLINGAETCAGEGLPQGACGRGLNLSSRTGMELAG